jgi:hypothetical protein
MEMGLCSCHIGSTGAPCKHQFIVQKTFRLSSWNFVPVECVEMKQLYLQVATGQLNVPDGWFASLRRNVMLPQVPASASNPEVESMEVLPTATEDEPPPPASAEACPSEPTVATTLEQLDGVFNAVRQRLTENPDLMMKPVSEFIKNFTNIKTESSLASALTCFGKYSGVAAARSGRMLGSRKIGVQPESKRRRRLVVGGKSRNAHGRPCAAAAVSRKKDYIRSGSLPPRRKVAQHSLSQCVAANQTLGKRHHAK